MPADKQAGQDAVNDFVIGHVLLDALADHRKGIGLGLVAGFCQFAHVGQRLLQRLLDEIAEHFGGVE